MFQRPRATSAGNCVLGTKVRSRGPELSSEDHLVIEGSVEGTIAYQSRQITIGKKGRVKADVHARVIVVEGTIEGDLQGEEAVHMRRTACVVGNITSPRIILDDGALVRGNLRTSPQAQPSAPESAEAQAPSRRVGR